MWRTTTNAQLYSHVSIRWRQTWKGARIVLQHRKCLQWPQKQYSASNGHGSRRHQRLNRCKNCDSTHWNSVPRDQQFGIPTDNLYKCKCKFWYYTLNIIYMFKYISPSHIHHSQWLSLLSNRNRPQYPRKEFKEAIPFHSGGRFFHLPGKGTMAACSI